MEEKKTIDFKKFTKLPDAIEVPPLLPPEKFWEKKLLEMTTTKPMFYAGPRHMKPTISGRIRRFFARLRDDIYEKLGGYIDE